MRIIKCPVFDSLLIKINNQFYLSGPLSWYVNNGVSFRSFYFNDIKRHHIELNVKELSSLKEENIFTKSEIKKFFIPIPEEEALELLTENL